MSFINKFIGTTSLQPVDTKIYDEALVLFSLYFLLILLNHEYLSYVPRLHNFLGYCIIFLREYY